MAKIEIYIDYVERYGRTFVIPSEEDLSYNIEILTNRIVSLKRTQGELQDEIAVRTGSDLDCSRQQNDLDKTMVTIEQSEAMIDAYEKLKTRRKELLLVSTQEKFEFVEPSWEDVTSSEEKFRNRTEAGVYVTDRQSSMFSLLRKCCPRSSTAHPAFADYLLGILRRYTEPNPQDLPFISL